MWKNVNNTVYIGRHVCRYTYTYIATQNQHSHKNPEPLAGYSSLPPLETLAEVDLQLDWEEEALLIDYCCVVSCYKKYVECINMYVDL